MPRSGDLTWSAEAPTGDYRLDSRYGTFFFPWNLLAATPAGGVPLINGTQTFVSWTAPNDGNIHRCNFIVNKVVTSNETGGNIGVSYTPSIGSTLLIGAASTGTWVPGTFGGAFACLFLVRAGQTLSLTQSSALTAGASSVIAELWGS